MDSDGLLKNLSRIKKQQLSAGSYNDPLDSLNSCFDLLRRLI